jgi:hypothetical protein
MSAGLAKAEPGTPGDVLASLTGGPAHRHPVLMQFAFDRPERND